MMRFLLRIFNNDQLIVIAENLAVKMNPFTAFFIKLG